MSKQDGVLEMSKHGVLEMSRSSRRTCATAVFETTLVAFLLTSISCPGVFAQLSGGTQKAPLQATIVHAEQLAPVQNSLKVGAVFDQKKLEAQISATRIWYRVPPWMAGDWQYEDYTQTFYQDYKTGAIDSKPALYKAQGTDSWGLQLDRLGGVWGNICLPSVSVVTADKEIDKDLHLNDSVIFDSDARVIQRYVYTRTQVDKSNIIRSVYQMECFTTFFPFGPGLIRSEASMKQFDDRGNPVNLAKSWRIGKRIAPFKPKAYDPSFGEYLKSEGLDNLVPLQK